MPNFREHSKNHNWESNSTTEHINAGSLQRIADATEKMAGNYISLQNSYDFMRQSRDSWRKEAERLKKSNAALRGHIKRLKKATL